MEAMFGETVDRNLSAAAYKATPVRDMTVHCTLGTSQFRCELKPALLRMEEHDQWTSLVFYLALIVTSKELAQLQIVPSFAFPGRTEDNIEFEGTERAAVFFPPWHVIWKVVVVNWDEVTVLRRLDQ